MTGNGNYKLRRVAMHMRKPFSMSARPPSGFGEDTTPYFEKKACDARRERLETETEILALEGTVLAKHVLGVLGWANYQSYENDLVGLLG